MNTDKQPQTVFIPRHQVDNKRGIRSLCFHSDVVHDFDGYYSIKESVYIHTPEELDALKAAWQMEQWVSVEDRLPEESENVLMHYELVNKKGIKHFATYLGFYYYGDWKFAENGDVVKDRNVTHWMPLPQPPKQ